MAAGREEEQKCCWGRSELVMTPFWWVHQTSTCGHRRASYLYWSHCRLAEVTMKHHGRQLEAV